VLHHRWEEAKQGLLPFSHHEEEQDTQGEPVDRERTARSLLHLSSAAMNLYYFEDAERHLRKCLKVLRRKPLQGPQFQLLRIQAHYFLALTYSMRGFYPAAIEHYEEALRLFLYVDNDEELANIYYGLCDTYCKAGRLHEAQLAGERALHLYVRTSNRSLEGRMRNLLGNVAFFQHQFQQANTYLTEALSIAASQDNVQMVMINCETLAQLRVAEGYFEEARRYSQRALEMSQHSENHFLRGKVYQGAGKVVLAEAEHAEGEQRRDLLAEATAHFETAHTFLSSTEAYEEITETLILWAQACEALGRSEASLQLWRLAYQTQSKAKGLE
jgi:tetratricopeptide (TPR) repeat protein